MEPIASMNMNCRMIAPAAMTKNDANNRARRRSATSTKLLDGSVSKFQMRCSVAISALIRFFDCMRVFPFQSSATKYTVFYGKFLE